MRYKTIQLYWNKIERLKMLLEMSHVCEALLLE